jgi:hypothetical protein
VLASSRAWTLLTGDGELRALAQAKKVQCFGVLWLCDQIFDSNTSDATMLLTGLEAIAGHPRCRLPRAEIAVRLEKYRAAIIK